MKNQQNYYIIHLPTKILHYLLIEQSFADASEILMILHENFRPPSAPSLPQVVPKALKRNPGVQVSQLQATCKQNEVAGELQ